MDGSVSSDLDTPVPDSRPEPAGSLPNISDYWPDAPHRMGPAADWYPDGTEPGEAASPPYPPQPQPTVLLGPPPRAPRRGLRIVLAALAAVVFLGGSVLALARMVLHDGPPPRAAETAAPAPQQPDGAVPAEDNPPVSVRPAPDTGVPASPGAKAPASPAPAGPPFTSGTFELTGDVVELNVTVADLGAEAVRFTVPGGSGLRPRLTRAGDTVKLDPNAGGSKGSGRLDVRLNREISWAIRMTGGVTRANYALAGARLRRVDLGGGAFRITMDLGKRDDTLAIRMSGGVNTWQITTAGPVPVTALLRDGGGKVVLFGRTTTGIDRNKRLSSGSGGGGLNIDAVAGLGTLTVAAN